MEIHTYNERSGTFGKADHDQILPDHIINTEAKNPAELALWKAERAKTKLTESGFDEKQADAIIGVVGLMRGSF